MILQITSSFCRKAIIKTIKAKIHIESKLLYLKTSDKKAENFFCDLKIYNHQNREHKGMFGIFILKLSLLF